jgi:hypothetical protein
MPILEDVKEYMQRATGLRRPGKKEAPDLRRPRKPHTALASRMTVLFQIIRAGRSLPTGALSISVTVTIRRP